MAIDLSCLQVGNLLPIDQSRGGPAPAEKRFPYADDFNRHLENLMDGKPSTVPGGVSFSKHAATRLESRKIGMSTEEMMDLNRAIGKLEEKGARSSLVLTNQAALIVNVKNRRVVTAMDRAELKENVFTNIDSTIVI